VRILSMIGLNADTDSNWRRYHFRDRSDAVANELH
jgi:hypothetical protein